MREVVGSSPTVSTTSEQSSLCSVFLCRKNLPTSLLFLFRKRLRSHRLFACKRTHNAFGSLPTCEYTRGANISVVWHCRVFVKTRLRFISCHFFIPQNLIGFAGALFLSILFNTPSLSHACPLRHTRLTCLLSLPPFCEWIRGVNKYFV